MCSSWRFLHAGRFWHMPFKSSLQLKEQHSEGGKLKHFNFPKAHPVTDCCHSCHISPFPAVSETIIVRKFKWKPQADVLSSHSFVFWGNNHCKSGHSCTSSSFMSNTWALSSYSCVLSVSAVRIPFWHLEEAILIFWFADAVSVDFGNSIFTAGPTQRLPLPEPAILSDNCRGALCKKPRSTHYRGNYYAPTNTQLLLTHHLH